MKLASNMTEAFVVDKLKSRSFPALLKYLIMRKLFVGLAIFEGKVKF